MKILVYGVGVIGSIFAGKMAQKGYDITVLARGNRYKEIEKNGIVLTNSMNRKTEQITVKLIDTLIETDVYDYIIVAVQNTQIDDILPVLSKNKSPNVVFVVNNPLGYQKWIDAVGYKRIMIGFPSAGGVRKNGEIHCFIGKGITNIFQSTTFGELDGVKTERLTRLLKIFKHAGFQPTISKLPDAWQKTHVAVILPIAKALYCYQSNNYELSKSYKTLKNMILGTRELFRILKSIDAPITPKKLYFYYLPTFLLVGIWQVVMKTKIAEFAMAQHTIVAKNEMAALETQFMTLNAKGIDLTYYNLLKSEKSNERS